VFVSSSTEMASGIPRLFPWAYYRQYGMYGPPPYCKRKDEEDRIGLRECIRPLLE
jgi:hypothetical protein